MLLMLVVLASVGAATSADCDACIEGTCHSRKTIIQGFDITDRMAIDRLHHILYVQLNSNMNSAFFLDDLKIQLVQKLNTTGMTVDQDKQVLYTADSKNVVYKFEHVSDAISAVAEVSTHMEADMLLFHDDILYYTTKCGEGLYFNINNESFIHTYIEDYHVTDFAVDKHRRIFFVVNNSALFKYDNDNHQPTIFMQQSYLLSTDKNGVVYFGDSKANVIYKMDTVTNETVVYAAYETGSVDKFVFDDGNNIVFHDAAARTVSVWKSEYTKCFIEEPHVKYLVKEVKGNSCTDEYNADMIPNIDVR